MMIATDREVHKPGSIRSVQTAACQGLLVAGRWWNRLGLACTWFMLCSLGHPRPSTAEPVRYELKDIMGEARLPDLHTSVELRIWEPDVRKGIEVLLDITNTGSEPVDLFNPIERASIYLLNREINPSGGEVSLPDILQDLGRAEHVRRFPEEYARVIAEVETRRPYVFVKESHRMRARNDKGVEDVVDRYVRLEPGGHLQWRVRFTRIMADPKGYWAEREKPRPQRPLGDETPLPPGEPRPRPAAVPIPAGTYQLGVQVPLTTRESVSAGVAAKPETSSSRGTNLDLITVRLGPKAKPGE